MVVYSDNIGNTVKLGDILWYDEGKNGARSIQIVVEHKGELAGKAVVYSAVKNLQHANMSRHWMICKDDEPVELCFYTKGDAILTDAVVIGNEIDNPEMLTIEYAQKTYKP